MKPGGEKEEISRKPAEIVEKNRNITRKNIFLVIWRLDEKNRTVYNVRRL